MQPAHSKLEIQKNIILIDYISLELFILWTICLLRLFLQYLHLRYLLFYYLVILSTRFPLILKDPPNTQLYYQGDVKIVAREITAAVFFQSMTE